MNLSIPCLKPLHGSHHPRRELSPTGMASELPEIGPHCMLVSLHRVSLYFWLCRYQPPGRRVCCYLCQGHDFFFFFFFFYLIHLYHFIAFDLSFLLELQSYLQTLYVQLVYSPTFKKKQSILLSADELQNPIGGSITFWPSFQTKFHK